MCYTSPVADDALEGEATGQGLQVSARPSGAALPQKRAKGP